jgi:hypothetical protein
MLFKEEIAAYNENRAERINTKCRAKWLLMRLVHIVTIRL